MKKQKLILCLLIGLFTLSFTTQTKAATLTVTTTTDELASSASSSSTGCSLREAIQNINDYASGHTSFTYTECGSPDGSDDTIVLESGENYAATILESSQEDLNASGDFDIKGDVIIQSDGSTKATISGQNQYRILHIRGSSVNPRTVTLNNVEVTNGLSDQGGGCLKASAATLTLENVTIMNCSVSGSSGIQGGGLYLQSVTATVSDSQFTNCSLTNIGGGNAVGGALYGYESTISIENTSFGTGNSVSSTHSSARVYGGAIQLNNSIATINQSSFSEQALNGASGAFGGAISITNTSTASISNSTFYQNRVNSSSTAGTTLGAGAIYIVSSTANISNTTISNNEVITSGAPSNGGGIYIDSAGTLNLKNSIVADNTNASIANDIEGNYTSYGYNIVENYPSGTVSYASGVDSSTDLSADPSLDITGSFGSNTTVVTIPSTSNAVDAGSCTDISGTSVNTDQIGNTRDSNCDIGAFEFVSNESGSMCEDDIDNDGDGLTDCNDTTDCSCSTWYEDADSDGYGSATGSQTTAYSQPSGYSANNTDCDDTDATLTTLTTYYPDIDGDGYGDSSSSGSESCGDPGSSSLNNEDCDDGDASVYEIVTYYLDPDGDGYGDSATSSTACENAVPSTATTSAGDCDESSALANPGITSESGSCSDGLDNDCDGSIDSSDSDCTVATTTEEGTTTVDDPTITTDPTEDTPDSAQGESGTESTTDTVSEAASSGGSSSGCQLNPSHKTPQASVILMIMALFGLVRFRHKTSHN